VWAVADRSPTAGQQPEAVLRHLAVTRQPRTTALASPQILSGNTALALLLTIASNVTSVVTLPLLLPWALKARGAGVRLRTRVTSHHGT
jgi:hypothetical protein